MLPNPRKVRRRSAALTSAFALAVTGLLGATAAPAHAATTDLTLAYVMDAGAQAVRVVDTAHDEVVSTIPVVGSAMRQIVASPDNRTAYLVNDDNTGGENIVSVIDTATSAVTHTVQVCDYAQSEAVKPDGSQLWIGCGSGYVSVIDTATATLVKTLPINVGGGIGRLMFSPDGSAVYLMTASPASGRPEIEVVDSATGAVRATISDGRFGSGMVMSPDASTLLVAEQNSNSVAVVDTASGAVTSTIPLGGTPDGGVLNPTGTAVYYCVDGSSIAVVDLAGRSITRTLSVRCGQPAGYALTTLSVAPDGTTLWADLGYAGLSLISAATGAVTRTIPTDGGSTPGHLTSPVAAVEFVHAPLAPSIASISYPQGPDTGNGEDVLIDGGPFLDSSGTIQISFGGVPASGYVILSDNQLNAAPPAHTAGTVDVTITTGNGTSAVGPNDRYTYIQTPKITGLSTDRGVSSGGTTVVITGRDLGTTASVYFGGTAAASFTVDSDTQVTAVTRAQHDGRVPVRITNAAGVGNSTYYTPYFTFFAPVPIVTSIGPPSGPTPGGTTVTITGTRFSGTFRVDFGGVAVPYTLVSDTQITVVTPPWAPDMTPAAGTHPAGPGGQIDVTVTTDVDTSAISSADVYDYVAPA